MKRVPHHEAAKRRFPESVVFIVTTDGDGATNVMPAGWSTFTSGDPLMVAVSVGVQRHTHGLLRESEEFVVAFPSAVQKDDVEFCGSNSGADVDKIAASGLRTADPAVVSVPLLVDAVACFECRDAGSLLTGDHRIFAGEVVAAHVSETYDEKLNNLGRAWGDGIDRFATLSELLGGDAADARSEPEDV